MSERRRLEAAEVEGEEVEVEEEEEGVLEEDVPTVEIGFVGARIAARDDNDAFLTKVGGRAALLLPQAPVPACRVCGAALALLLQAYTPLAGPPDDRRQVLLFVCPAPLHPPQHQRFFAYRLRLEPPPPAAAEEESSQQRQMAVAAVAPAAQQAFAEEAWDEDGGDSPAAESGTAGGEDSSLEKLQEKLAARDSSIAQQPQQPPQPPQLPPRQAPEQQAASTEEEDTPFFEPLYVQSEFEPLDGVGDVRLERAALRLLQQYQQQAAQQQQQQQQHGDADEMGGEEAYEPSASGDRAFRRFQKRVGRAPAQVVRWCFGGSPLQVADQFPLPVAQSVPPCPLCGSPRTFELQLLPTLMNFLRRPAPPRQKRPSQTVPPYCDFGTIVMWTCSNDCITHSQLAEEALFMHPSVY